MIENNPNPRIENYNPNDLIAENFSSQSSAMDFKSLLSMHSDKPRNLSINFDKTTPTTNLGASLTSKISSIASGFNKEERLLSKKVISSIEMAKNGNKEDILKVSLEVNDYLQKLQIFTKVTAELSTKFDSLLRMQ